MRVAFSDRRCVVRVEAGAKPESPEPPIGLVYTVTSK